MRIGRLLVVILALTAATLSAAPHKPHRGGSAIRLKAAGGYWFYCYSNPGRVYDCNGTACGCKTVCADICQGPCDWDDTCID